MDNYLAQVVVGEQNEHLTMMSAQIVGYERNHFLSIWSSAAGVLDFNPIPIVSPPRAVDDLDLDL